MSVYILGSGAIGRLLSSFLAEEGRACTLIHRRSNLDYSLDAKSMVSLVRHEAACQRNFFICYKTIKQIQPNSISNIFVTTKGYDALQAVLGVKPFLKKRANVVLFQNGLGFQNKICSALPEHNIWAAVTTHGARKKDKSDGPHVYHTGEGETWFGALQVGLQLNSELPNIQGLLPKKMDAVYCDDIQRLLWLKLAVNSVINPLSILYNTNNGNLLSAQFSDHLNRLISEIAFFLSKKNLSCKHTFSEKVYSVLENTSENISSSLQDFRNGQQTELPFINGYLLKVAKESNIEMFEHKKLQNELRLMNVHY